MRNGNYSFVLDLPPFHRINLTAKGAFPRSSVSTRAFGIRVTTSRPDAPFGQDAVDAFMIQFKPEVSGSDQAATGDSGPSPRPNDNAADPRTKGRGKKKGIPPVSGHDPV